MIFNCILAFLAVFFGNLFLRGKSKYTKWIFGVLWILFLPNTIYLLTDMVHIIYQWAYVSGLDKVLLIMQFTILQIIGFVTFIFALAPYEHILGKLRIVKRKKLWALIGFNFLIAFGMVLGRIERLNSWDVFVNLDKVFTSVINSLTSFEHLGLLLLLGLFCNFFYFLFRDPIYRINEKLIKLWVKKH